ncbi:MAG: hypothetical protein HPY55_00770 [Firmicutes bacterium]|nr:hypothetical protein [Bacillota bacterium]
MEESLSIIAQMMAVAARTAPKAAGQDFVTIKVVTGGDVQQLANAMDEFGKESGKANFDRDAANVRSSPAVLLLGLKDAKTLGLNCGACGVSKCADLKKVEGPEFAGGLCAWRIMDLGIALGSAAKTASIFNADNRMMYRAGVAARRIGMIDADVVVGIPISATGKSIYFDRK